MSDDIVFLRTTQHAEIVFDDTPHGVLDSNNGGVAIIPDFLPKQLVGGANWILYTVGGNRSTSIILPKDPEGNRCFRIGSSVYKGCLFMEEDIMSQDKDLLDA